jgi:hypothetical protein
MFTICTKCGTDEKSLQSFGQKTWRPRLDAQKILWWALRKQMRCAAVSRGSVYDTAAGSCGHGLHHRCRISWLAEQLRASYKGLCSMGLVTSTILLLGTYVSFALIMFWHNYIIHGQIFTSVYLINEDKGNMFLHSIGNHLHGVKMHKYNHNVNSQCCNDLIL